MKKMTTTGKNFSIQSVRSEAEKNVAQGKGEQLYFSSDILLAVIETLENKNSNFIPNQFVPGDFLHPDWKNKQTFLDWKNYISQDVEDIWDTFTVYQKATLALNAKYQRANVLSHNIE